MSDNRVIIFDTTLRDGEQSPGISLNIAEKVEIAQMLARLGVDVIEAGFPIASEGDFKAVQAIAREVKGPTICGLARAVPKDINRCFAAIKDAKKKRIHTFIATSNVHMEKKLRMSEEAVLTQVKSAVTLAKSYVDDVEFSPEDASRTDFDFMIKVLKQAVESGATTLNIPDTVGYATPFEFAERIEKVRQQVPGNYIISTHCHNDLGLAVANSLAGARAGARQIEVAVNGIGERAGNAALEEVVMAIKMRGDSLGNLTTTINTEHLAQTSRLVSRLTGYPVQYNKAIVGRNAFAHESGIHQDGVIKHRETYEIMDPKMVGQTESKLVLGKHSGRNAVKTALTKLGITLSDEDLQAAFIKFKDLADKKGEITDSELEALVSNNLVKIDDAYIFKSIEVQSKTDTDSTATVTLVHNTKPVSITKTGTGMVDAVCSAIRELTGVNAMLIEYNVGAVTQGLDAVADVFVQLSLEGRTAIGRNAHTDVVEASGRAYLSAINRLLRESA